MTASRCASSLLLILVLLLEVVGGMLVFPQEAEAASFSNLSHGSDINDLATYTFSAVALGAGSASRIVVVGFSWRDTNANSMLSATIGGAPMTKIVEQQHDDTGNGSYTNNSLWVARVPSGTSADIVLTLSDVAIRAAYAVGTLPSGSLVPYDTATATGVATLNSTLDVPENGTVFALAGVGHATYTGAAWTGATEFADTSFEVSAYSAATLSNATLETNRAVNTAFTLTSGVDGALVAASFSPQASLARPANNLGLVGYWSFNEGTSTQMTDLSGKGNHLTLGTGNAEPVPAAGKRGSSLFFSGDDFAGRGTLSSFPTTGSWSASAWVKPTNTWNSGNSGTARRILNTMGPNWYEGNINMLVGDIGDSRIGCYSHSEQAVSTTQDTWTAGMWYHIACAYDATAQTLTIYVNGIQSAQSTGLVGPSGANNAFYIGAGDYGVTEFADATIDEVRVYSRAIGPSEVAALAGNAPGSAGAVRAGVSSKTLTNGSTLGASGGLVGHWTFDGSDFGTAVIDGSGNGRNGFVQGAATSSVKAKGKLGQGVNFNESGYVITVPDNAGLNFGSAQDFSVSFYAQARAIAGVYAGMVGDKLSRATNRIGFLVAYENGGVDVYISDGVDEVNVFSSANAISDGAWHHIVLTASRTGNASLYIDGVSVGTPSSMAAVGSIDDSGSPVLIGDVGFGGQPFDGVIDDVRIYNKVLTLSEIQQLSRLGQATVKP